MYQDHKCRSYQNRVKSDVRNQSKKKSINGNRITKDSTFVDVGRLVSKLRKQSRYGFGIQQNPNAYILNYSHLND